MTRHVLIFTDRPEVDALFRSACTVHGLSASVRAPSEFADTFESVVQEATANGPASSSGAFASGDATAPGIFSAVAANGNNGHSGDSNAQVESASVVIDTASEVFDEDELLASLGVARAVGAIVAVMRSDNDDHDELDELLEELCPGLVARTIQDVDRIAAVLARRLDGERGQRFEFVTVSADGQNLLTILGDGTSDLTRRPISTEDDGGTVVAIDLSEDAKSARIELDSGVRLQVRARDFASRVPFAQAAALGNGHRENGVLDEHRVVDGQRLGKRLRALRKEAGLTQAELARRTGIHRPNIARVEAGRHTPSLETLSRLATAIGVSTTRVLSEE